MGYDCKSDSVQRFERTRKRQASGLQVPDRGEVQQVTDGGEGDAELDDSSARADAGTNAPELNCADCPVLWSRIFTLEGDLSGLKAEKQLLQTEVQSLLSENISLKKRLHCCSFSEDSFSGDCKEKSERVKYYTGLPNFLVLMALVNFLAPHISKGPRTITTSFQETLIVLMRLRLNLPVQVLADIFLISTSATSRIFLRC